LASPNASSIIVRRVAVRRAEAVEGATHRKVA